MKRLTWVVIALFYLSTISAWAAPNARFNNVVVDNNLSIPDNVLSRAKLQWGSGSTQLPRYFSADAFTDNLTLYSNDLITKGPWVNVRSQPNFAYTGVPIQSAINSLDNTIGGTVYIPRGTYTISNSLYLYGKSNVRLIGDGIGATILNATTSLVANPTRPQIVGSFSENYGILDIDSVPARANTVHNIYISGISFRQTTVDGSIDPTDTGVGGLWWQKVVYFSNVHNLTFDGVEIYGGNAEALYGDGATGGMAPENITVKNSQLRNGSHNAFNINAGPFGDDIKVIGNTFDNCFTGVQLVGQNIIVSNNTFLNTRQVGITVGEANYAHTSPLLKGSVISNNIINGTGAGRTGGAGVVAYGIQVVNGASTYTDNTEDLGLLVSGNVITNTNVTTQSTEAIRVSGNASIINNIISGLKTDIGTNSRAILIGQGSTGGGTNRQTNYISGNIVDNTVYNQGWQMGISVNSDVNANTSIYMSNNKILGAASGGYGLYVSPGGVPFISLNGDTFNEYLLYTAKWTGVGLSSHINYDGSLNGVPLYGDTFGGIATSFSRNVLNNTFTDNATTPSVKHGGVYYTSNTGSTTITKLLDGIQGQEVTIMFTDNLTTLQNGTGADNMKLSGATNFVATPDDVITLIYKLGIWYQISGSVN